MTNYRKFCLLTMLVSVTLAAVPAMAEDNHSRWAEGAVVTFQPAGPPGNRGVLVEGDTFPPGGHASARLKRTNKCLKYRVRTSGLPQGAYTNWWAVISAPEKCAVTGQCNPGDLFNPATDSAVFLATGSVVSQDGVGKFKARVCKGEDLGFPGDWMNGGDIARCREGDQCTQDQIIGPQHLFGQVNNPKGAAVIVFIKYHGPASADPAILYDQTHTLLATCTDAANAYPVGGQCFDPQMAVFQEPGEDDD